MQFIRLPLLLATLLTFVASAAAATPEEIAQLRQRAENGDMKSQFVLARTYERGEGVPVDKAEAVKWYRTTAERGHMAGQSIYAMRLMTGSGTKRDLVESYAWLSLAAAQGHKTSIEKLPTLEQRLKPKELAAAKTRVAELKVAIAKRAP